MAQRTKRRSHHSSGAAAGLTGPAIGSTLHSVHTVDTHQPALPTADPCGTAAGYCY